MNMDTENPLVLKKAGGTGGGGAELSEAGKNAIKMYEQLKEDHRVFLINKAKELKF